MIRSCRFFIVAIVVLIHGCSVAQPGMGYTSADKKAIKYLEEAVAKYNLPEVSTGRPNYKVIEALLDAALKKDPTFTEAYVLKSQIYKEQGRKEEAVDLMEKGLQYNPGYSPSSLYFLCEMEFNIGRYAKAKQHALEFLKMPRNRTNPDMQEAAQMIIRNAEFAMKAMEHPVPFDPTNLGPGVNTENAEYFPTISGDDMMLLFTRLLPDDQAYGGLQEDFFYSIKDEKGVWGDGINISRNINTIYNEGAPSLGVDGQSLIFAACDLSDGYGADREGKGSCDLFYTRKEGNEWRVARNLGAPLNTFHWETQPSLSADGRTLYFIRGLVRVNGQRVARPANPDIYVAYLQDNGEWTQPERLPDYINTPGNEASVLIHPDGQTLYFASDGHVGMGGLDLYMCRREPDGSWGRPVNLGYPINTWNDENSLLVSSNGEVAFFASNRDGGYGDLDLYSFPMPANLRPVKTTYMKGIVYDVTDKSPLGARFELIDLASGKRVAESFSNRGTGEFLVSIPTNRDYALNVQKDGYVFFSKNFTLTESGSGDPFLMDVPLVPITMATNSGFILENVFFDTDKANLKAESKVELDKLVDYLKRNENLHIQLRGHTDDQGDDAYNLDLSDRRAKAVMQYLIDQGIDAARLSAQGFGETQPIETNDTPEGRARNRRTEYVITKH